MTKYHGVMAVAVLSAILVLLGMPFKVLALSGLFVVVILILAAGSIFPQIQFYLPVTNGIRTSEKVVSLTFDDGPDKRVTPELLELLKTEKIPAAFFYIGRACEANPQLVRKTMQAGHLLGNHSFGHLTYWAFLPAAGIQREIEQANQVLFRITGQLPKFYRPPFGVTRPGLGAILKRLGMTCIGWQVRALEGFKPDQEKILQRIVRGVRPGSIIMLHESYYGRKEFDAAAVVARTRKMIAILREKGYRFVRLDQLLEIEKGKEV
ncbi:polysaccharide deacetylase family protein [bacterium]|nr:polysaccharide deacetylase family protein [bacterium]